MEKHTYQVRGGGKSAVFSAFSIYDAMEQWLVIHPNIPPESAIRVEIHSETPCECGFCASDAVMERVI